MSLTVGAKLLISGSFYYRPVLERAQCLLFDVAEKILGRVNVRKYGPLVFG